VRTPGAIDAAKPHALVIYLHARPETAVQRAAPEGTRPALMGEDPLARMRLLQKEREQFYQGAHAQVDTERKLPPQVANEVVRLAQSSAGW